jgi:hypothetical protein
LAGRLSPRRSTVHFALVADLHDQHPQTVILDTVNDPVFPGANPVKSFFAGQFAHAHGPWVAAEPVNDFDQPSPGGTSGSLSNCRLAAAVNSIL